MTQGKWMVAAAAAVVGGAMLTAGRVGAAPATEPAAVPGATTKPAVAKASHHRLTKPWSDLKSLTPKQQDQIYKIHEDAFDQEKKLKEKEHDDVVALLTPEQQAELPDAEGKAKSDRKEKIAETHKKKSDATTRPAK